MSVCRDGVPDARWDDALSRAGGHFLQTAGWQRVQKALGAAVCHADSDGEWMWAGHLGGSIGLRYMYVPLGPTVITAKGFADCLKAMRVAARERGAAFVRFEPMGAVDLYALLDTAKEVKAVQPKHTWILDLDSDEKMLRRGLAKGHRSAINGAERRGISMRVATDPAEAALLVELLRRTSKRGGFSMASPKYYTTMLSELMPDKQASLYIAEIEGAAVAAAVAFDFDGVRHYAYAGADPEIARRVHAAAPLVWRMILDAKAAGMHTFDFWGVLPRPRRRHKWTGFTQFKQAFGGRPQERAGTWEMTVSPLQHRAYRIAKWFI